jgi:hypothetical protein
VLFKFIIISITILICFEQEKGLNPNCLGNELYRRRNTIDNSYKNRPKQRSRRDSSSLSRERRSSIYRRRNESPTSRQRSRSRNRNSNHHSSHRLIEKDSTFVTKKVEKVPPPAPYIPGNLLQETKSNLKSAKVNETSTTAIKTSSKESNEKRVEEQNVNSMKTEKGHAVGESKMAATNCVEFWMKKNSSSTSVRQATLPVSQNIEQKTSDVRHRHDNDQKKINKNEVNGAATLKHFSSAVALNENKQNDVPSKHVSHTNKAIGKILEEENSIRDPRKRPMQRRNSIYQSNIPDGNKQQIVTITETIQVQKIVQTQVSTVVSSEKLIQEQIKKLQESTTKLMEDPVIGQALKAPPITQESLFDFPVVENVTKNNDAFMKRRQSVCASTFYQQSKPDVSQQQQQRVPSIPVQDETKSNNAIMKRRQSVCASTFYQQSKANETQQQQQRVPSIPVQNVTKNNNTILKRRQSVCASTYYQQSKPDASQQQQQRLPSIPVQDETKSNNAIMKRRQSVCASTFYQQSKASEIQQQHQQQTVPSLKRRNSTFLDNAEHRKIFKPNEITSTTRTPFNKPLKESHQEFFDNRFVVTKEQKENINKFKIPKKTSQPSSPAVSPPQRFESSFVPNVEPREVNVQTSPPIRDLKRLAEVKEVFKNIHQKPKSKVIDLEKPRDPINVKIPNLKKKENSFESCQPSTSKSNQQNSIIEASNDVLPSNIKCQKSASTTTFKAKSIKDADSNKVPKLYKIIETKTDVQNVSKSSEKDAGRTKIADKQKDDIKYLETLIKTNPEIVVEMLRNKAEEDEKLKEIVDKGLNTELKKPEVMKIDEKSNQYETDIETEDQYEVTDKKNDLRITIKKKTKKNHRSSTETSDSDKNEGSSISKLPIDNSNSLTEELFEIDENEIPTIENNIKVKKNKEKKKKTSKKSRTQLESTFKTPRSKTPKGIGMRELRNLHALNKEYNDGVLIEHSFQPRQAALAGRGKMKNIKDKKQDHEADVNECVRKFELKLERIPIEIIKKITKNGFITLEDISDYNMKLKDVEVNSLASSSRNTILLSSERLNKPITFKRNIIDSDDDEPIQKKTKVAQIEVERPDSFIDDSDASEVYDQIDADWEDCDVDDDDGDDETDSELLTYDELEEMLTSATSFVHDPNFILTRSRTISKLQHQVSNISVFRCLAGLKFFCKICDLSTTNPQEFDTHLKIHSELWSGKCDICDRHDATETNEDLAQEFKHLLYHSGYELDNEVKEKELNKIDSDSESGLGELIIDEDIKKEADESDNEEIWYPQPWLNKENQKVNPQSVKDLKMLAALYKCMDAECNFYTTNNNDFKIHLDSHESSSSHLLCPYCNFIGQTSDNTCDHIENQHKYDDYQCRYCFFRTKSQFAASNHLASCHPNSNPDIIKCQDCDLTDHKNEILIQISKYFKRYNCPFGK